MVVLAGCKWDDSLHRDFVNDDGTVAPKCPGLAYIATANGPCGRDKCEDFKSSFKHDNCPKHHVCQMDEDGEAYCDPTRCPAGFVLCGGGRCISPDSDPEFCGSYDTCEQGVSCSANQRCQKGECKEICGENVCVFVPHSECVSEDIAGRRCGSDCVDCNENSENGKVSEYACRDSQCVIKECMFDHHMTGEGTCVENKNNACGSRESIDVKNCMDPKGFCVAGRCVFTECHEGFSLIMGECHQGTVNQCGQGQQNCGKTFNGWGTGVCKNEKCEASSCTKGFCLNKDESICIAGTFNIQNCGMVGEDSICVSCGDGEMCIDGECVASKCSEVPAGICPAACDESCLCQDDKEDERCGSNCTNCKMINHVKDVTCDKGACNITECQPGYHIVADSYGMSCAINTPKACGKPNEVGKNCEPESSHVLVSECREGECVIIVCASGYAFREETQACEKNSDDCCGEACTNCERDAFVNGVGFCRSDGKCEFKTCKSGFNLSINGQQCLPEVECCGSSCTPCGNGETCHTATGKCQCGTTGQLCQGEQICNNSGQCACPSYAPVFCGNTFCINPDSDARFCGAGANCTPQGRACTAGQICSNGSCQSSSCSGVVCGGECIDPKTSAVNCGAQGACSNPTVGDVNYQGAVCSGGTACVSGSCVCPFGQILCNGSCINPQTSPTSCGARGTCSHDARVDHNFKGVDCGADASCVGGLCQCKGATTTCSLGETCNGSACQCGTGTNVVICENPENPENHCSNEPKCRVDCSTRANDPYVALCDEGASKKCINSGSNNTYCGARGTCVGATFSNSKGRTCSSGQTCVNGSCLCSNNMIGCGSGCVDPRRSNEHCGAGGACVTGGAATLDFVGSKCGGGTCKDGMCECSPGTICRINETCVGGECKCGTGKACASNEFCSGNDCLPCLGNWSINMALCDGKCIRTNTSSEFCGARRECNSPDPNSSHYKGVTCSGSQVCLNGVCVPKP